MKIDAKFNKEVRTHVLHTIKTHGIEKTKTMVSDTINELSQNGDAIYHTYQILYYSYFLKLIKEEFNNQLIKKN
jgi:hypothetical protein